MQQIAYFFKSEMDDAGKIPLEGRVKCSLRILVNLGKRATGIQVKKVIFKKSNI